MHQNDSLPMACMRLVRRTMRLFKHMRAIRLADPPQASHRARGPITKTTSCSTLMRQPHRACGPIAKWSPADRSQNRRRAGCLWTSCRIAMPGWSPADQSPRPSRLKPDYLKPDNLPLRLTPHQPQHSDDQQQGKAMGGVDGQAEGDTHIPDQASNHHHDQGVGHLGAHVVQMV